jgi:UDP-N-acetylmuramoyl-L-alanyl-D-glutamate--2,6-diaminopimelate ligase
MFVQKIKKVIHFSLAWLAYWYYGRPARKLIVVGVTGTKGKSTTCRLIASVLEAGGYKVGLLSTVEFQIGEKRWMNDKKMTMLGRGQIQKMLQEMVKAGCQYAVVETSSEGILQYRHYGLHYDISVFTNLGTEHSERHGGFENLKRDKGKIFAGLKKEKNKLFKGNKIPKVIIANTDDGNAEYYLSFPADVKWAYGINGLTSHQGIHFLEGRIKSSSPKGIDFVIKNQEYHLNIVGDFNVYNALAACAVGFSQQVAYENIVQGLASVNKVAGRMEFIEEGQDFKVVVDYAHEPMSLTALFHTLREMVATTQEKVIAVIGSDGGGRDISKREKMGYIAGELCDIVVVTDVNCFDEDPKEIAEMLAKGARKAGKIDGQNLFIEIDRREGIKKALTEASAGDMVVITAKGTEPCIVVAQGKKIPWDDRQVARELLQEIFPLHHSGS